MALRVNVTQNSSKHFIKILLLTFLGFKAV
jgi:hypothetical protein